MERDSSDDTLRIVEEGQGGCVKQLAASGRTIAGFSRAHRPRIDPHGGRGRRGRHVELRRQDAVNVEHDGPFVTIVDHDGHGRRES